MEKGAVAVSLKVFGRVPLADGADGALILFGLDKLQVATSWLTGDIAAVLVEEGQEGGKGLFAKMHVDDADNHSVLEGVFD